MSGRHCDEMSTLIPQLFASRFVLHIAVCVQLFRWPRTSLSHKRLSEMLEDAVATLKEGRTSFTWDIGPAFQLVGWPRRSSFVKNRKLPK